MDQPAMLALVGDIYDAVTEPERWTQVLDAIGSRLNARILMGRTNRGAVCDILASHGMPAGSVDAFHDAFGLTRPVDFIHALPRRPLAEPLTPEAFQGEDGFLASPIYLEVFQPFGFRYMATAVLHREPGWLSFITLHRPPEAGPFAPAELEEFHWLARHLGRAVALQYALASSSAARALLAEIIDRFDRGAMAVDARGGLRLANRAARRILNRRDGLIATAERLQAWTASETKQLLGLIAECAATSSGTGMEAGGMLAVSRRGGGRAYAVIVSPLSAAMLAGTDDRTLALVLVSDPERPLPTEQQLRRLHGFTPGEARLALRLMLDETPAEAARMLGLSITTVRFHLSNMLAKTGTRRQAELLALLSEAHSD